MNDAILLEAARWAALKHAQHVRKHNGQPYIRHPQRIAARAACLDGMSIQGVAACFLHDVPEECAGEDTVEQEKLFDFIQVNFGTLTYGMVKELTPITKGLRAPRAERKLMERNFLNRARPESKRIKLLDRIDNLQELLRDMQLGLNNDYRFNALYLDESMLLLDEALRGTDPDLEAELVSTINASQAWITQRLARP